MKPILIVSSSYQRHLFDVFLTSFYAVSMYYLLGFQNQFIEWPGNGSLDKEVTSELKKVAYNKCTMVGYSDQIYDNERYSFIGGSFNPIGRNF